MKHDMLQAVNNVLTLLGSGRPNIITVNEHDQSKWDWRVADEREQDTFVAFTGTLFGCLTVQAEYEKEADRPF